MTSMIKKHITCWVMKGEMSLQIYKHSLAGGEDNNKMHYYY